MDNSRTKKENIGYTYKGFVGYHPIFAYLIGRVYAILPDAARQMSIARKERLSLSGILLQV
jgi:hypothetical protein